jgi:hypothetical protein
MINANYGNKTGFRVLDYFVTFPDGDFVKEDKDGRMYVLADIYKINKDNKTVKVQQNELTPEIEELINDEINNILLEAMNAMKNENNK